MSKTIASILIKPTLRLHSLCYNYAGKFGIALNNGVHPKHEILAYKEWFFENIPEGSVILDIGCNTGLLTALLSKKATHVYGIEIERTHLEIANEENRKENITYICANAEIYDYSENQKIDYIVLSNVLEHIEDRVCFLKNLITRVNWKNSRKHFLIRVPMLEREWIVIYKQKMNVEYRLDQSHFIEYTFESLESELEQAGIEIEYYKIRFGEIYIKANAKL